MSSNAQEYADSIFEQINRRTNLGAPFGLMHQDTEEWTDETEAWEDWQNNPDTEYTEASAFDYLTNVLDIHYVIGSDKQYKAGRVCIAFGGPTAWLNTYTGNLEVSWWSAPETRELPRTFIEQLDDALEDLYNC